VCQRKLSISRTSGNPTTNQSLVERISQPVNESELSHDSIRDEIANNSSLEVAAIPTAYLHNYHNEPSDTEAKDALHEVVSKEVKIREKKREEIQQGEVRRSKRNREGRCWLRELSQLNRARHK
jgi:hypothetical protein